MSTTAFRRLSPCGPIVLRILSRDDPRRSITKYSKYCDLPHAITLGILECPGGSLRKSTGSLRRLDSDTPRSRTRAQASWSSMGCRTWFVTGVFLTANTRPTYSVRSDMVAVAIKTSPGECISIAVSKDIKQNKMTDHVDRIRGCPR